MISLAGKNLRSNLTVIWYAPIHKEVLGTIVERWKKDPEVLCILLYGSVARGTAHKHSDIDIEIFRRRGKTRHIETRIDGVDIDLYIYPIKKILGNIKKDPCLAYPYLEEKILFERNSHATRLINSIRRYFRTNKDIQSFWKTWTMDYLRKKNGSKKIKEVQKLYSDRKDIEL